MACVGILGLSLSAQSYDIIPAPLHVEEAQILTYKLNVLSTKKSDDPQLTENGYKITLSQKGVRVFYGGNQGRIYARATLAQLRDELKRKPEGIPTGVIIDKPHYEWRGFMIDLSRHYMPLKNLKKIVDELAYYKFNKLHLHLTDDQGWRFEVPDYPRLKSHGNRRKETNGDGVPHGGIYSRAQLQSLVKYCAERGIDVIPEVDIPSHNQALVAAYPAFCCQGKKYEPRTRLSNGERVLVCPANKELAVFYKAVMKELALIFPYQHIHLGGDEAPTTQWDACPDCQAMRKERGQKNGKDQMRDFLADMATLVRDVERQPIFWYELNDELYREGETVMPWYANQTKKAIAAAKAKKLRLIITNSDFFYLDFPQLKEHRNYNWMPVLDLEKSYSFNEGDGEIRGVQCNLWTERIPSFEHAMYQFYPRALAIAELGWTPAKLRNWDKFQKRLEGHNKSYEKRRGLSSKRLPDNQPSIKKSLML